jgi:p21-activated kinase 5
MFFSFV